MIKLETNKKAHKSMNKHLWALLYNDSIIVTYFPLTPSRINQAIEFKKHTLNCNDRENYAIV